MQTLTDLKDRTRWAIDYIAKKNNLNNAEIGRAVGSKPDTVRKYRSGVAAPRPNFLQKFCDSFGVDFQWLANGVGMPFPGEALQIPGKATLVPVSSDDGADEASTICQEAMAASELDLSNALSESPVEDLEPLAGGIPASEFTEVPSSIGESSMLTGVDSEMSFQKLAVLAGIKINNEWILKLSKKFGIDSWKISLSIYQQQIDNELIHRIEGRGFEKQTWIVRSETKNRLQGKDEGELNISQLLKITEEVLRSNTIHSTSLAMNIISLRTLAEKSAAVPVSGARAINLPENKSIRF